MLKKIAVPSIHKAQKYKKHIAIGIGTTVILTGLLFFVSHTAKRPIIPKTTVLIPTLIPVPKKVTQLIDNVNKKTQLPQGETPSVATVTDIKQLPNSAFFAHAQNGDKVLLYTDAKRAYLYRPATDQIIRESTIELTDDSDTSATASAVQDATNAAILRVKY